MSPAGYTPRPVSVEEHHAYEEAVRELTRHRTVVAAFRELMRSLDWEKNRSGITYNGYEDACAALATFNRKENP